MGYRDEQGALLAKIDAMERTLREQTSHNERQSKELEELREKLSRLAKKLLLPAQKLRIVGLCVVASVLASVVVTAIFGPREAPAPTQAPTLPQTPRPEPIPAPPPPIPLAPPAPPPPSASVQTSPGLSWSGKIESMRGTAQDERFAGLGVGAACSLEIRGGLEGLLYFEAPEELEVRCNGRVLKLWVKSPTKEKPISRECTVWGHVSLPNGVFAFRCQERGVNLVELELDTTQKKLRLFSSVDPGWEVLISLERPTAAATLEHFFGKVYPLPISTKEQTHKVSVTEVQGKAPVSVGATCDLVLSPNDKNEHNCKLRLLCQGKDLLLDLYDGRDATCIVDDALVPISVERKVAREKSFSFDLVSGTGTLFATEEKSSWGLTFALSKEP